MCTELLSPPQAPYEYHTIKTATKINQIRDLGEELGDFISRGLTPEHILELIARDKPYINALLMAGYDLKNLPPEYRHRFEVGNSPGVDMKPEIYHGSWYLCSSSETNMGRALEDQTVMLAGGLVVKLMGRITGLCVKSFSTDAGTFIKGNFYSPDGATQAEIKRRFVRGSTDAQVPGSRWFLMRAIDEDIHSQFILRKSEEQSRNMPSSIPDQIYNKSRRSYLDQSHQSYDSLGY